MENLLGIVPPDGYQWLLDRGLVGFGPFTQLQPWHYIPNDQCFWATDKWKNISTKRLLAFARRQDCDDLACFVVGDGGLIEGISLIHGWTQAGFDVAQEFPGFWEWLKHVIEDIAEWVSPGP